MYATPAGKVTTVNNHWLLTIYSLPPAPRVPTTIRLALSIRPLAWLAQLVWSAHTMVRELWRLVLFASQVWLAHLPQLHLELIHAQLDPSQMQYLSWMMFPTVRLARMVIFALRELTFSITQ